MHKLGPVQKKIILLLMGGVALGITHSPRQYYRILRGINREWKNINQQNFNRSVRHLSRVKLVEGRTLANGSFKLVLTPEGRRQAEILGIIGNSIKLRCPKRWDGRWRIVIFDIPEKYRMFRGILRDHLYELDFYKLQNSVFASPYPYEKEILDLICLYKAEPYVRVITAVKIDNENRLKNHFFKSSGSSRTIHL